MLVGLIRPMVSEDEQNTLEQQAVAAEAAAVATEQGIRIYIYILMFRCVCVLTLGDTPTGGVSLVHLKSS